MNAEKQLLYIGESFNLLLEGLLRVNTNTYKNDATITVSVRTSGVSATSGTELDTFTLNYVAASNGNYRADSGVLTTLTQDTDYWIWVSCSGFVLRRIPCRADFRGVR